MASAMFDYIIRFFDGRSYIYIYPPYNFLLQIDLLQVRVKVVPYTFQAEVRYKLALCIYINT